MKRIFLAFLILGIATFTIPALRERAEPRIDASREWLGEKLEGPLSPILTPYRTLKTESNMAEAARHLIRDRNRGRPAPAGAAFSDYLSRNQLDPLDAWGAPLSLRQEPDSVAIVSSGPDLVPETEDDLVAKVRYKAAPSRRIRRR